MSLELDVNESKKIKEKEGEVIQYERTLESILV